MLKTEDFYLVKEESMFIIIAFAIAGYLTGTLMLNISKPYYKTSATIQSNTIENASLIDYINRIHLLSKNRDSLTLAKELSISVTEATKIKDLQAFWMIDLNKDGIADEIDYKNSFIPDTISKAQRIINKFTIQLYTFDPAIIPDIQSGLETYIDTYPRIKHISQVKKQNLHNEINRINDEIEILDSLRKYEYFVKDREIRKYEKNVIKINELLLKTGDEKVEPVRLLHTNILELNNQNLENTRKLELETDPYIFLSSFIRVNNPVDIETETGITKKIIALFIILSIFISFLIRDRKVIFEFLNKK